MFYVFFFKQKTAYEMRISDWSSDVCSSDLLPPRKLSSGRSTQGTLHGAAPAPNQVHDQRHHQQHQEYEEKDLRDAGGSGSNSAEAEDTGDDRHDEEHKSPVKHGRPQARFAE